MLRWWNASKWMLPHEEDVEYQNRQAEGVVLFAADEFPEGFTLKFWWGPHPNPHSARVAFARISDLVRIAVNHSNLSPLSDQEISFIHVAHHNRPCMESIERCSDILRHGNQPLPCCRWKVFEPIRRSARGVTS